MESVVIGGLNFHPADCLCICVYVCVCVCVCVSHVLSYSRILFPACFALISYKLLSSQLFYVENCTFFLKLTVR
jgi:hypothetical protein